jgi:hypothetical protein
MQSARRLSVFFCLLLVAVGSASAHGVRGRVGIGVNIGPYWGPWMFPPPWYYQPAIVVPPPEPKVYIERNEAVDAAFWHYCRSLGGYYPYIRECPEGWLQVLPEAEKQR